MPMWPARTRGRRRVADRMAANGSAPGPSLNPGRRLDLVRQAFGLAVPNQESSADFSQALICFSASSLATP